jgi:hypothetical protein
MQRWSEWVMRTLAGLLAAGILAPFLVRLPDRYQPSLLVAATAIACVATALLWRTGRSRR